MAVVVPTVKRYPVKLTHRQMRLLAYLAGRPEVRRLIRDGSSLRELDKAQFSVNSALVETGGAS